MSRRPRSPDPLREAIRRGDPLAGEGALAPADAARIRRAALAHLEEPAARGRRAAPRAALAAALATLALVIAVGGALWRQRAVAPSTPGVVGPDSREQRTLTPPAGPVAERVPAPAPRGQTDQPGPAPVAPADPPEPARIVSTGRQGAGAPGPVRSPLPSEELTPTSPAAGGPGEPAVQAAATLAVLAGRPERQRRRVEFASPGGTRVVWVLDSEFTL